MDFNVLLLYFLTYVSCVTTSKIDLTVTPDVIKHLVTDELSMRCSLMDLQTVKSSNDHTPENAELETTSTTNSLQSGTSQDRLSSTNSLEQESKDSQTKIDADNRAVSEIKFASSIAITRDGADVATVSAYSPAASFENSTGVQVSGGISGTGPEPGYLQVTWAYPGPDQQGRYTCTIGGFDLRGHPVTVTKTVDVSDTEVTIRDLVTYIHQIQMTNKEQKETITNMNTTIEQTNKEYTDTIAIMNATIKDNMDTISSMNITIKGNMDTISNLNKTIENLQTKEKLNAATIQYLVKNDDVKTASIANLTSNVTHNMADINQLSTKVNTNVIFTAGVSYLVNSQAMIFNKVITNLGGDYNNVTGVFTCRVPGTYFFIVHVVGSSDKLVFVYLKHNGHSIVRMQADDGLDNQSASNSATIKLAVGDTVYVSPDPDIYASSQLLATFTGILVAKE